ncbi:MAG: transcriptional repressor [Chloroflexi bacterium]|nr:transcriptional repressor [Chloroflexota bacterium]
MSHDMTAIASQLRQAGYRVTPQRQLILDAICVLGGHVTPEEVYEQVKTITPSLNRATVYRTLHFLSEQRIITVTQLRDGRFRYELAGKKPHHHLVCQQCGDSIEIPHTMLNQFYSQMETDYDFTIDMNHISFFGFCAQCRHGDKVSW